jgi:Tol biopolymer transport system component
MSPEQVRGEAVDHRSDIFSFGVVLYEMLTGRQAFGRDTAAESMAAILKEDPPELSSTTPAAVPPALARIVQRCLEKKPAERFQSARDLAFALESSSGVSGVSGAVPSVSARAGFRPRTWMWALGSAAVAAVLTALLLHSPRPLPQEFTRLTFRLGAVVSARFSPDGQTVVYSASWEGRPAEVFTVSSDGANPRSLGNPGAFVRSVSSTGDIAILTAPGTTSNGGLTLAILPRDGGAPRAVSENVVDADWGPDGSELAVIHQVKDKQFLEYPIGTKLYESSKWLVTPRVSRDGTRVAVFESSGENSRVLVVDRKGGRLVFATGLRADAPGLAWSPDGEEIWLSKFDLRENIKRTYAVNARGTFRLLFQDPSLTDLADVSRDGRVLYVRNIRRILTRIKAPGEQAERDFSWLDRTEVADLSADGKTLIFGEGGTTEQSGNSTRAFMVTTSGGLPTNLGAGSAGCLSTDGAWVLGNNEDIPLKGILFPTGPGQPRLIETPGLSAFLGGCLLAGGRQALVAGREPGQTPKTYVVDLETGRQRLLSSSTNWAHSVDGTQVAFRDEDGNLAIQPVSGGAPRVLAKLQKTEGPLRWSLDGKSVYLVRDPGPGAASPTLGLVIDRWDLATGARTPWKRLSLASSATTLGFFSLAIAPEADAYAYSYLIQQASDLFVVKGLR